MESCSVDDQNTCSKQRRNAIRSTGSIINDARRWWIITGRWPADAICSSEAPRVRNERNGSEVECGGGGALLHARIKQRRDLRDH